MVNRWIQTYALPKPMKTYSSCLSILSRSAKQRRHCKCTLSPTPLSRIIFPVRTLYTSGIDEDELPEPKKRPRWEGPHWRMTAPFRSKPPVYGNDFIVNEDPQVLDKFYERVLGNGGAQMLPEEVKWLVVTHKSFDHGRRGYNDRMAFLGKRIVYLQASLLLINAEVASNVPLPPDKHGRVPFQHPALEGLEGLTQESKTMVGERKRIAQLAIEYGVDQVARWRPKMADNLGGSGVQLVYAQILFAIVGALALQKGGVVANTVARKQILAPLGLTVVGS